jgi:hypothetical protein
LTGDGASGFWRRHAVGVGRQIGRLSQSLDSGRAPWTIGSRLSRVFTGNPRVPCGAGHGDAARPDNKGFFPNGPRRAGEPRRTGGDANQPVGKRGWQADAVPTIRRGSDGERPPPSSERFFVGLASRRPSPGGRLMPLGIAFRKAFRGKGEDVSPIQPRFSLGERTVIAAIKQNAVRPLKSAAREFVTGGALVRNSLTSSTQLACFATSGISTTTTASAKA